MLPLAGTLSRLAATRSGALGTLLAAILVPCAIAQPPARFTPGSIRGAETAPDPTRPADDQRFSQPLRPLGSQAGTPPVAPRPQAQPADDLVAQLLSRLRGYETISCRLRQKVTLLDQELLGSGNYWQQGRGEDLRFRWDLKIQVADRTTSVQHVFDGNYLWLHEDLFDKTQLRRIDAARLRQAVLQDPAAAGILAPARLAVGGMPKLFESLAASFQFVVVQQDRLDGVPVWMLRGTWRPAALLATYPSLFKSDNSPPAHADEPTLSAKLPSQVPDVAVLFVGRDDLFPYRLEYRRRVRVESTDAEGRPVAVEQTKPLLLMEWFEVALNTPLDERNFIYRPGDLNYTDGTNKLLEAWGLLSGEQK